MFNFIPSFLKLIMSWIYPLHVWLSSKDHWTLEDCQERCPSLTDSVGTLHRQRRTQKTVGEYNLSTEQHQSSYSHGVLSSPIELLSSLHDPHTTTTLGVQFHAILRAACLCDHWSTWTVEPGMRYLKLKMVKNFNWYTILEYSTKHCESSCQWISRINLKVTV